MKIIDENIGFVGLGNVGSKLANSLLISNYNLFLNDINKEKCNTLVLKGAVFCNSLEELASKVSVIITCLPSPAAVSEVIEGTNGLINYLTSSHLWIEMSTTDEKEMIRLNNLLSNISVSILEAPVTGGQHRAATGNIAILASGKRKSFDRSLPILSEIGYEILFCGKIGNASTIKIVTNYLASINLLAIGEALMVLKKYGIDLGLAYEGIKISSGNSFVHETETKVILSGSYDVGFTMDLVCKDLGLFDKLVKKFNIPAKISNTMLKIFKSGKRKLGSRSYSTSIVKLIENECNERLRANNFPIELVDTKERMKGFEVKF